MDCTAALQARTEILCMYSPRQSSSCGGQINKTRQRTQVDFYLRPAAMALKRMPHGTQKVDMLLMRLMTAALLLV